MPDPIWTQSQFAVSVTGFSSQYSSTSWSASQATGSPNTYPTYGDISTAWASLGADDQREFLQVSFPFPAPITTVSIYETFNPGAVDTIYVKNPGTGSWVKVWEGTASPAPAAARIFSVNFPLTSFNVGEIRIAINSPAVSGWNEIDALAAANNSSPTKYRGSSYDGYSSVASSFSNFDGVVPSSVKNLGGSYDGFSSAAAVLSNFSGAAPVTGKYYGGNHDGFSMLLSLFSNLNGAAPVSAKYLGGSYDGHAQLAASFSALDGNTFVTASKFYGGSYDGFSVFISGFSTLNGMTPSSAKNLGGSYDGSSVVAGVFSDFNGATPAAARYHGGSYDGHSQIAALFSALDGNSFISGNKFNGGSYDGFSVIILGFSNLNGTIPSSAKNFGGSYDGSFVVAGVFSNFGGAIPTLVKNYGGSYDGYAASVSNFDIGLPVELAFFRASESASQAAVKLEWKTESEVGNAYWIVMRKSDADSFATIARVKGQGTKTSGTDYSYIDTEIKSGRMYVYRLADLDLEGRLTLHPDIYVTVSRPQKVNLFQNYPNPFNLNTSFVFELPKDGLVELTVYNVLGQKVRTLVHDRRAAGRYTVTWDGRNEHEQTAASGIYFYRLQVKSDILSRKMLLVK